MATTCPQCGATFVSEETCRDRFDITQVIEFETPAYFAVHHLSVPSYLLQHTHYSRDGWLATRQLLQQCIYEELAPEEARKQFRTISDKVRSWTRGDKLALVDDIVWTRTIADVRFDTAEQYCADVREWARAVLVDTAGIVE